MKKILKNVIILVVIMITMIFNTSVKATENEEIDYTETLESFENPERGFYQYFYYNFKVTENELPKSNRLSGNLMHLRLGIGGFSKAVNGEDDLEFSKDMLDTFSQMLKSIKANGGTAIIRFSYDNFQGNKNQEPSLDMILKHISQLKPVFEENKDVISYIELGFFGPWGEMHSSDICTNDNISKAIDAMLDSAPEKIKIGVRQPKYYVAWANIQRSELDKDVTQEGTRNYRIGLFNDGYLGSASDLGTFQNREIEIQWLEKQALHTFYGGEVVGSIENSERINTAKYMSEEAFRTHTTYLNMSYDEKVIESWKSEIYDSEDILYKGQSGYTYINNHLGYRFVLRKSEMTESVKRNEKLNIAIDVENVGFANLVNDKVITLVLVKDSEKYEIKTNLNARKWNSTEITNINFETELPGDISLGEWKVYLRISQYGDINTDNNYQCIRLANNNIWNQDIGANYIGKFTVIKKQDESNEKEDELKQEEENSEKEEIEDELNQKEENNEKDDIEEVQVEENIVNDRTLSYKNLPYAGNKSFIVVQLLIIGLVIFVIYFYRKMKK